MLCSNTLKFLYLCVFICRYSSNSFLMLAPATFFTRLFQNYDCCFANMHRRPEVPGRLGQVGWPSANDCLPS